MARFLFDTVLTPADLTVAADNRLVLALGATTIVYLTTTVAATTTIISLTAVGGNVDGMVVCFSNITAINRNFSFDSENLTETAPASRFRSNSPILVVQYGAVWYRWSSVSQRWQVMGKV